MWGRRQNPKERVDQFSGSILVNAEQLFRGHAELLGVRVHAFPHGSQENLKVYLETICGFRMKIENVKKSAQKHSMITYAGSKL